MAQYFVFGWIMCYITMFIGACIGRFIRKYLEKRRTGGKYN